MSKMESRMGECIYCGEPVPSGLRGPLKKRCEKHHHLGHKEAITRYKTKRRVEEVVSGVRQTHCVVCGEEFSMTDGLRGKSRKYSSRKRLCGKKECYRDWHWFRTLGVSYGTYDSLYEKQGGKCAICDGWRERLRLDHCHDTGRVRGLLCNACNGALGQFGDRLSSVRRVIDYLQES